MGILNKYPILFSFYKKNILIFILFSLVWAIAYTLMYFFLKKIHFISLRIIPQVTFLCIYYVPNVLTILYLKKKYSNFSNCKNVSRSIFIDSFIFLIIYTFFWLVAFSLSNLTEIILIKCTMENLIIKTTLKLIPFAVAVYFLQYLYDYLIIKQIDISNHFISYMLLYKKPLFFVNISFLLNSAKMLIFFFWFTSYIALIILILLEIFQFFWSIAVHQSFLNKINN